VTLIIFVFSFGRFYKFVSIRTLIFLSNSNGCKLFSVYLRRTHSQISQVIREYRKTAYRVPMAVLVGLLIPCQLMFSLESFLMYTNLIIGLSCIVSHPRYGNMENFIGLLPSLCLLSFS
jgi:hypothetical protein